MAYIFLLKEIVTTASKIPSMNEAADYSRIS